MCAGDDWEEEEDRVGPKPHLEEGSKMKLEFVCVWEDLVLGPGWSTELEGRWLGSLLLAVLPSSIWGELQQTAKGRRRLSSRVRWEASRAAELHAGWCLYRRQGWLSMPSKGAAPVPHPTVASLDDRIEGDKEDQAD